jgi:CubicO group peptidase (beta-lactamase class C family)
MAFEGYFLGTKDTDRRISWSMAKSVLSAAFGVAVEEGLITDLDAPVIRYVPNLAGSAYEDATIRHVLNMASGVEFDEDYLDFNSDINRMGRVLALGRSMDGFAENLTKSARPPGSEWQYNSIDTHVLGMVLRSATGMSAKEYVSAKILRPMGLEANPTYLTDGYGVAFVLGGLNMRTRDYARFGLMMAQDGNLNGNQIVPREWVRASTKQSAPAPAPDHDTNLGYGYQWWLPPDAQEGEFLAKGIYGQYIYVNRPKGVVIALNSADRDWTGTDRDITHMNLTMFRAIADGLR